MNNHEKEILDTYAIVRSADEEATRAAERARADVLARNGVEVAWFKLVISYDYMSTEPFRFHFGKHGGCAWDPVAGVVRYNNGEQTRDTVKLWNARCPIYHTPGRAVEYLSVGVYHQCFVLCDMRAIYEVHHLLRGASDDDSVKFFA